MHEEFLQKVYAMLERHEGRSAKMYRCPAGYLTVGVGHNLEANPLPESVIDALLREDVAAVIEKLDKSIPWWRALNDVRRAALIDMGFNLGVGGLLGFRKALAFLQQHQYDKAADEFADSKWYTQVGDRGKRIVKMIRFGTWEHA